MQPPTKFQSFVGDYWHLILISKNYYEKIKNSVMENSLPDILFSALMILFCNILLEI